MTVDLQNGFFKAPRILKPEKEPARREEARTLLIARMVAACLVGGFFAFFKMNSQVLQELTFLALGVPAFFQIRWKMASMARVRQAFFQSLFYLVPVSASLVFGLAGGSSHAFQDAVVVLNLYYAFFVASVLASDPKDAVWGCVFRYTAWYAIPLFLYVVVAQRSAYVWGRWEPFAVQPNWWGMMAMGLAWGALMWAKPVQRYVGLGLAAFFLVQVQSRGSIVALVPALLFSSGYFLPVSKRKVAGAAGLFALFLLAIALSEIVFDRGLGMRIVDFVSNDILLLNDVHRGVGSGMSGRTEGYKLGWEAFLSSPVFGGGFAAFGFVHNGFLLTLAESGLFAFLAMLFLFGKSVWHYLRTKRWVEFGFVLSYLIALLTFPRSFNINMTGFLFLIILMKGLAPVRRQQPKNAVFSIGKS